MARHLHSSRSPELPLRPVTAAKEHWLQHPSSGTWHLWRNGTPQSACGSMTKEHLPAPAVSGKPPAGLVGACTKCVASAGGWPAAGTAECAAFWVGKIKLQANRARVKLDRWAVEDFADMLSLLGCGTPEANETFAAVTSVLLRPVTVRERGKTFTSFPKFRESVDLLLSREKLLHVAVALRTWRSVTGRDVGRDRFSPDRVIETMLSVDDPEPYVRQLHGRGLSHLAAVFHPNTLERARKDPALRGVFWDGSRGDNNPLAGVEVEE